MPNVHKYFDRKIIMPAKLLCPQNILAAKIFFCRGKHGGPDRPMFWQSILTFLVARQTGLLVIVTSKTSSFDSYVWLNQEGLKLSEKAIKDSWTKILY